MSLTVKAYAKINLWLDITGRRGDGYHTLNTVMRRVDLYDDITVTPTENDTVTIHCDDPAVPCDERNIVYKAWKLFRGLYGSPFGADIDIRKHIPLEAGLGGSSTDGAAVLLALNELAGKPFSHDTLTAVSVKLGADVPFCMTGGTAVCRAIGEEIQPISCADLAVVIVKPDFSCSTAAAYAAYDKAPRPEKAGFAEYANNIAASADAAAAGLYNVFEELYDDPRIADIRRELLSAGALGACMSGSGSAVFGIFPTLPDAQNALGKIVCKTKFAVNAL